jgi:hypothetical protein
MVPAGLIGFHEAPALATGEKLWGWYHAEVPFVVEAGPRGDAYSYFGYERTRTVYDPAFKHPGSHPQGGTADDEVAMQTLADRLLQMYQDVRRQGTLLCDGVEPARWNLGTRYDVVNLAPADSQPGSPLEWSSLAINAVQVEWNFAEALTRLTVANTFFMLPEYSEMKRRLELNLFAQRELDLSESIMDCQVRTSNVRISSGSGPGTPGDTREPAPTPARAGTAESYATLGGDAAGNPDTSITALTDTWSNADGDRLEVVIMTRQVEDFAGSGEIRNFYRTFTFSPDGETLRDVSAETMDVLADTEECC